MRVKSNELYISQLRKAQELRRPKTISVTIRGDETELDITPLTPMEHIRMGVLRTESGQEYAEFIVQVLADHVVWISELDEADLYDFGVSDKIELVNTYFDTPSVTKVYSEIIKYLPKQNQEDVEAVVEMSESLKN